MGGKGRSVRSGAGVQRLRAGSRAAKAGETPMFLQVEFTGLAPGESQFCAAVKQALTDAYGMVGSARFSPDIIHVATDTTSSALVGVLRVPGDQYRSVWAALTLLGEFRGAPARFLVTKHTSDATEIEIDSAQLEEE